MSLPKSSALKGRTVIRLRRHPLLIPSVSTVLADHSVDVGLAGRTVRPLRRDDRTVRGAADVPAFAVRVLRAGTLVTVLAPLLSFGDEHERTSLFRDLLRQWHRLLLEGARVSCRTYQFGTSVVHVVLSQCAAAFTDVLSLQSTDRVAVGGRTTMLLNAFRFLHASIIPHLSSPSFCLGK